MPVTVGPPEQPTSPARARKANKAVPPRRIAAEALLNVPGQRIPTEKPQTAQPNKLTAAFGTKTMQRYEKTHSTQLPAINRLRSHFSPYFPYNRREVPINTAKDIGPARSPDRLCHTQSFFRKKRCPLAEPGLLGRARAKHHYHKDPEYFLPE